MPKFIYMSTAFMIKFLAIAGGLTSSPAMLSGDKPCKAHIEKSVDNDVNVFTGVFENFLDEKVEGSYTLHAIREGQSGRSVSRQSGKFKAEPYEKVELSKVSVNIADDDAYTIVLKIYSRDVFFCGDSIVVKSPQIQHHEH